MKTKTITISSPARINIIGEHVDYNDGFVLPAAIDKKITLKLSPNGSKSRCAVKSKGFEGLLEVDLFSLKPSTENWHNYILGVLHELQLLTQGVKGFDCEMETNVPAGSGVSSSAALECGLAFGLNELFDLGLDRWQLAQLCQRAEHNFVGSKCGIMDQFASVMGKKDHAMLLDCQSLEFEYIPTNMSPYVLLMLNTNVTHNLATSGYNDRRVESARALEIVAGHFGVSKSYRNLSLEMVNECKDKLGDLLFRRSSYVLEENKRVLKAADALKKGDLVQLGELMYQSHNGQRYKYEVSCPELDFLVDLTLTENQILGSRMVGGGFGGCTLNVIHKDYVDTFVAKAAQDYRQKFDIDLSYFVTVPSQGTRVV
jgi:galactokinase